MNKKIILASLLLALTAAPQLRADKFPLATESHKINPSVPRPEPVPPPTKPATPPPTTKPAQVQMQNLMTGETRMETVFNLDDYMLPDLSGFWFVTVEQDGQLLSAEVILF